MHNPAWRALRLVLKRRRSCKHKTPQVIRISHYHGWDTHGQNDLHTPGTVDMHLQTRLLAYVQAFLGRDHPAQRALTASVRQQRLSRRPHFPEADGRCGPSPEFQRSSVTCYRFRDPVHFCRHLGYSQRWWFFSVIKFQGFKPQDESLLQARLSLKMLHWKPNLVMRTPSDFRYDNTIKTSAWQASENREAAELWKTTALGVWIHLSGLNLWKTGAAPRFCRPPQE